MAIIDVINRAGAYIIPLIIVGIPAYGLMRRVKVYEEFVEGAKEGFEIAVRIIPYLVAILVAIGMFRASGAMAYLVDGLRPLLAVIGFPAENLPMALMRPLSGSGSLGLLTDLINEHGVDSIFTKIAATSRKMGTISIRVASLTFWNRATAGPKKER